MVPKASTCVTLGPPSVNTVPKKKIVALTATVYTPGPDPVTDECPPASAVQVGALTGSIRFTQEYAERSKQEKRSLCRTTPNPAPIATCQYVFLITGEHIVSAVFVPKNNKVPLAKSPESSISINVVAK